MYGTSSNGRAWATVNIDAGTWLLGFGTPDTAAIIRTPWKIMPPDHPAHSKYMVNLIRNDETSYHDTLDEAIDYAACNG